MNTMRKTSSPRIRRAAAQRGYTVVEIMMAMTVFAIGAAGVIGMQRVTIQGGTDARRFDVGTNIANEWLFRLQRDSMFWTKPSADFPAVSDLPQTTWLKDIATTTNWHTPLATVPAVPGGMSPYFDVLGRDVISGSGDHFFCAQIRLQWIADPGASLKVGAIMRAEVRVFWPRLENAPIGDCTSLVVDPDGPTGPTYYHYVYATTAVRTNPVQ